MASASSSPSGMDAASRARIFGFTYTGGQPVALKGWIPLFFIQQSGLV
jgi:hypothetical protein